MILLIVGLFIIVFGIILMSFAVTDEGTFGGLFVTGFGVVFIFFGSLLPTGIAYSHQQNDIASIPQFQQNEKIYKEKADKITIQIHDYLAVQYPELEKSVIATMAASPSLLFIKFPQLRSSETLISLAKTVQQLQTQVYTQETNITQAQKNIRLRNSNQFFLQFFIPNG